MAKAHLLPKNSTKFERAVSETLDRMDELAPGIHEVRSFKYDTPLESVLPWLVFEYGLGPISQYLPNAATVIDYGVRWQRVKGTPQGVAEAFTWVGYAFSFLYEAPVRRTRWHLFELELDRFRDTEDHLPTLEAVGRLSQPVRSEFWRAYFEHNVREHDWSYSRWGDGIWGDVSGVRLHAAGVKWSFGRTHEPVGGVHNLTEEALAAAGAWVPPPDGEESIGWGSFPWSTPDLKWASAAAATRDTLITAALLAQSCWIGVYRQDGSPIGFRKARVLRRASLTFGGYYQAGANSYIASSSGPNMYVEALMDFGEGEGETAASWSITLGGSPPDGSPPGQQWVDGAAISGGSIIGGFTISDPVLFGKTSRERFRAILHIV